MKFCLNVTPFGFIRNEVDIVMITYIYAKRRNPTYLRDTKKAIETINSDYKIESICTR